MKAMGLTVIAFAIFLGSSLCYANPIMTVTAEPETSAAWDAGTLFWGWTGDFANLGFVPLTSQTNDPLGPFNGQSITFLGTNFEGASTESFLPGSKSRLVYRYRLDFDQAVDISSIIIQGAAFNFDMAAEVPSPSFMRLLDSEHNMLNWNFTWFLNFVSTNTLLTPGATGRTFYLDEFDTSSTWRYRSSIVINATEAVPEPTSLLLLGTGLGVIGIGAWRRRK